jgi:hypothetical protein
MIPLPQPPPIIQFVIRIDAAAAAAAHAARETAPAMATAPMSPSRVVLPAAAVRGDSVSMSVSPPPPPPPPAPDLMDATGLDRKRTHDAAHEPADGLSSRQRLEQLKVQRVLQRNAKALHALGITDAASAASAAVRDAVRPAPPPEPVPHSTADSLLALHATLAQAAASSYGQPTLLQEAAAESAPTMPASQSLPEFIALEPLAPPPAAPTNAYERWLQGETQTGAVRPGPGRRH